MSSIDVPELAVAADAEKVTDSVFISIFCVCIHAWCTEYSNNKNSDVHLLCHHKGRDHHFLSAVIFTIIKLLVKFTTRFVVKTVARISLQISTIYISLLQCIASYL